MQFEEQLAGDVEYTDSISAEVKTAPTRSVPYMTLHDLNGEAIALEFGGMWSIQSLLLLPRRLWPGVRFYWIVGDT